MIELTDEMRALFKAVADAGYDVDSGLTAVLALVERDCVVHDYEGLRSTLYRSWNESGRTLTDVADEIGCAFQHVSVSLRGTNEMRGRRLFDLTHALGYDLALVPREPTT